VPLRMEDILGGVPPDYGPLIVIDGVVQDEEMTLEDVNALDVYHIEIIKDEATVGLYGERARQGVIRITTKAEAAPVVRPRDGKVRLSDVRIDTLLRLEADSLAIDTLEADSILIQADATVSDGPLIVIDGVVQDEEMTLEEINELDIERIEIVKGEAAIGLYGPRARNGAIQITTKG